MFVRRKRSVLLPFGARWRPLSVSALYPVVQPGWQPVGAEDDPADDHEERPHQPDHDGAAHVLGLRGIGYQEVSGEVYGLIGHHRIQVPQEGDGRHDGG